MKVTLRQRNGGMYQTENNTPEECLDYIGEFELETLPRIGDIIHVSVDTDTGMCWDKRNQLEKYWPKTDTVPFDEKNTHFAVTVLKVEHYTSARGSIPPCVTTEGLFNAYNNCYPSILRKIHRKP